MRRLKRYGLAAVGMLALATAILLVTGGGTALATGISKVFVTNTASNPVPVREQNRDANGNIKVHEQGTAKANVTNTDANGNIKVHEQGTANVNVVGTVTTQNPAPANAFSLVGGAGQNGCDDDLPAGTRWFLTSVAATNTFPVPNQPGGDVLAGTMEVRLESPGAGDDVQGPPVAVRSSTTNAMTFPQPFVLTSPADGYCLQFEAFPGVVGVVVGYRQ